MSIYTVNTTQIQDDAIAHMLAKADTKSQLAGQGYTLDAAGFVQGIFDGGMRVPVSLAAGELTQTRLAKLAANPDVLAQVDALATPVAKP